MAAVGGLGWEGTLGALAGRAFQLVDRARVDDGSHHLAAVEAAKKTKFPPGIKSGVPVKTAKSLTSKIVSN